MQSRNGSTSSLLTHLERMHNLVGPSKKKSKSKALVSSGLHQVTLTNSFAKAKNGLRKPTKDMVHDALKNHVIRNMRPFNAPQNLILTFKDIFPTLDWDTLIPSAYHVKLLIESDFKVAVKNLKEELSLVVSSGVQVCVHYYTVY
jgi:hypothetical protein